MVDVLFNIYLCFVKDFTKGVECDVKSDSCKYCLLLLCNVKFALDYDFLICFRNNFTASAIILKLVKTMLLPFAFVVCIVVGRSTPEVELYRLFKKVFAFVYDSCDVSL